MSWLNRISAALLAVSVLNAATLSAADPDVSPEEAARLEFFEKKVRPLLVNNCYACHSAETNSRGGLRVDDRNGLLAGGGRGSALVPGKPDESLLLKAVRHTDKLKMPPGKQLSEEEIAILQTWIEQGAAWPAVRIPSSLKEPPAEYEDLKREHWAWQPLQKPAIPAVQNVAWPKDDIDRFVLARLEQEQLAPVDDASKVDFIRRVTFDLTGLPPTTAEIDTFLADESPDSTVRLVDRLLASPAYGEHWARHWLDLARFGESTGSARNLPMPHSWRYRDYVIRAFQQDKPYNKFLQEQIAGDLLPASSPEERDELQIATGFLAIGVKDVNQRFKVRYIMDNVDEQIDTVTRSVLALTASCARCHDHKFDPIPTADYYGLAGIFRSSDLCDGLRNKMGGGGLDYYDSQKLLRLSSSTEPPDASPEKIAAVKEKLEAAKKDFEALKDSPAGDEKAPNGKPKRQVARQKMNRLQQELNLLTDPAAQGPVAFGVRDAKQVADTEIRIRGEAEKLGPVVPRGFLSVLSFENQPQPNPQQSGRLELAQWLTHEQNALSQRVIVNRVWQHLFGKGLVQSVDNFGTTGDTPSHPELLDHLAHRFVQEGWSIKRLVRTLVLTRAYQLSSTATPEHLQKDPANRLVWRHTPRRLTAEELRDAMLTVAGRMNLQPGEASTIKSLAVIELPNNGPEAKRITEFARNSVQRSIYLPFLRGIVPPTLEAFDFADQGLVVGSRDTTTVPQQALYLLNDPFVRRQSLALATTALKQAESDTARFQLIYRTVLGRLPTDVELARAQIYLVKYEITLLDLETEQSREKLGITEAADVKSDPPAVAATTTTAQPPIIDPDQVDQSGVPPTEEVVEAPDAKTAAWASFIQALLGSGEFRYLK